MSVKNDAMTEQEKKECKVSLEIELAVQEWGIKNGLRLFGITVAEWGGHGKRVNVMRPMARAYFIDPGYKTLTMFYLDRKETGGKVTVSMSKSPDFKKGYKYPIKILRTKNFDTGDITPVIPLYWVLVNRGIILPFRSVMKRGWGALPFEDMGDMKPTEI